MSSTHSSKTIREQRKKLADGGEPLYDEPRSVQQLNSSLYVNVTDYAVKTLGLSKGQKVNIETFRDGIWIEPVGGDGDE